MSNRLLLLVLGAAACTERPLAQERAESALPAQIAAASNTAPPPLQGERMHSLEGDGAIDVVSPPLGAREPRPVVVALHGMDAQPAWVCNDFRATFGPWPFIVCAQGNVRSRDNHSWGGTVGMQKAIVRALAKTEAQWPGYVLDEGRVLVTYSQSASMAPALLASKEAPRFAGGFFLEGFNKRIAAYAPKMATNGLSRSVFFATQPGNRPPAEGSAKALQRAGTFSQAEYGGKLGHWFTPKTVPALRKAIPVLVDGLEGWQAYPGPPDA